MNKLRTLMTWGLLLAATHVMGYTVTVSPVEMKAGQSTNLIINLTNTETNLTAYQIKLFLPTGVTVQKKSNGKYAYTINADRHDGAFSPSVKDAADGSVLITCYSSDKDVITGTSGELIRLSLDVASTVTTSLQGSLKSIEFTDVQSQGHKHADVSFSLTLSVKQAQTLSLTELPEMMEGDVAYTLPQNTDQNLTLTWSVADATIASISGNKLTPLKAGTTTVTATQAGNNDYLPFTMNYTLTVKAKQAQTLSLTELPEMMEGDAAYTLPQNTDQNLTLTWSVADATIASISGNKLTPLKAGTTTVTATQAGNNDYLPFTQNYTLTVKAKQAQTLSLTELPEMTEGDAAYTLPQNTDQNLTLTWSVADATIASISGNKLTPLKAGTTTVTATQAGNNDYLSFSKTFTLTVKAKQAQTLSLTELPEMTEGDVAYTLPQNTDQNLTLTWSVADATIASISGNKLTPLKAGTTTVTATQAGNNDYLPFTQNYTLTVNEKPAPTDPDTDISGMDNVIYIEPCTAEAGSEYTLSVKMKNSVVAESFGFDLVLPEGISVALDEYGDPMAELSTERTSASITNHFDANFKPNGSLNIQAYSTKGRTISGYDGEVALITIQIAGGMALGTYPIQLKNIAIGDANSVTYTVDLVETSIEIVNGGSQTILDETSTTAPAAATNVDVRVNRTLKAGVWSTICLPFAMTEDQTKAAFGEDVELAEFTGYECIKEGGDIVGIIVKFDCDDITAIEANHPCLIKVSSAISEFTVDGVDISPEEEPTVATVERSRREWSEMIGTYVANTTLEETMLFLNDSKFWYSTGNTKMKAFRAYFDFYDLLTEVEESAAPSITLSFDGKDGDVTKIDGRTMEQIETGRVYNTAGQYVGESENINQLPKGVYIVNGKKKVIK